MRPFNMNFWRNIGLFICLGIITACGSGSDLLDTPGFQYTASLLPQDGDTETHDIDVVQVWCDATTVEDFYDMGASVTIRTDKTGPDLQINRYVVEVTPIQGVYSQDSGTTYISFNPPTLSANLTSLTYLDDSLVVNSNGTLKFDALIWTMGQKRLYLSEIQAALNDNATYALYAKTTYNVHVTFYATTEENNEVTMEADMTVYLSNISNCSTET